MSLPPIYQLCCKNPVRTLTTLDNPYYNSNRQSLTKGLQRIDLVRHASGIISFPLPSPIKSMLSTSIAQPNVVSDVDQSIAQPHVVSVVDKSIISSEISVAHVTPLVDKSIASSQRKTLDRCLRS